MQTSTIRPKEDQNLWNFVFSVFFIMVLIGALWVMREVRGGFLVSVEPFDAVLMAFASFRVTRLIVYDKISRWFRELFVQRRVFEKDGKTWVEITPFGRGFRHTIYNLLECPWCIGIWSGLIVMVCYFIFPWAWSVIFFLALAGAGSLIQIFANFLGWRAEYYKLEANIKEKSGATSDRSGL
ncbi:MAG: hypothetical protein G01um101456_220 [Parcubacteria group bacterium Gr01-1014_56]|nr:MAG: hypothetical protein G01um101456_220 [Parcubacteria group bacterium Gr01-1014_56]